MVDRSLGLWMVFVLALLTGGCVSVQLPSIAHVHVGHAVTAWPDTPGRKGLLEVAQQDARILAEHAAYAVAGARDIAEVRLHLGHVLHALSPALEPLGPGTGYGLMKALDGSADHLGFAREVKDASANIQTGLTPLIETLRQLRAQSEVLAALARDARQSRDAAQVVAYAEEVRQRGDRLLVQLDEARKRLDRLLAAEVPAYQPIAQRYLFGVIRLPTGEWVYKLDAGGASRAAPY